MSAEHEQRHRPDSGDSVCTCGEWAGPMTELSPDDKRSFRRHQLIAARLDGSPADLGSDA